MVAPREVKIAAAALLGAAILIPSMAWANWRN